MDKEQIKEKLKKEGYTEINVYDDSANEIFPDHTHEGEQKLVVVRGSMEVKMEGKEYSLTPGDELVFPAKVVHSAKMGPEGCEYIDGEKA